MKMDTVIQETCKQYVARRLSEGWRVAGRYKHLVFLSPPDGSFIRPVDLRNDVETLRPNAVGDYTNIASQYPTSGAHWDKVNEVTPDEDSTYVHSTIRYPAFEKDAYKLQDTNIPAGSTINSVKVYFRYRNEGFYHANATPYLRLGGNETEGTLTVVGYESYVVGQNSEVLSRPGGGSWSVSDLNNLQVAIAVGTRGADSSVRLTQVYVEVDYTPPTAYKDTATRFRLWVQNYQDIATRFKLWVQKHTDTAIRFKLIAQEYKDISGRFRLTAYQLYQDANTRFKLAVQAHQDIGARFRLIAQAYQDIVTRFRLTVKTFIDIGTRFKLQSVSHQNVSTRFFLYLPSWKSLEILKDIEALEAKVAGFKREPKAHFEI